MKAGLLRMWIGRILRKTGIRKPVQSAGINSYLNQYGVEIIFDIGANTGQSVRHYRNIGYKGPIISYEPIPSVWEILKSNTSKDANCVAVNKGIAAEIGMDSIYVTANGAVASSFLPMTPNVVENAPEQSVVGVEKVVTTTLENELEERYEQGNRAFLKIDVQGMEDIVLASAGHSLDRVVGLIVELSLLENYSGEVLLYEQLPKLYERGFRLVEILPGWRNPSSGELYQVDALLFRTERSMAVDA